MFLLEELPIDTIKAKNTYQNDSTGALVSFEGLVRADRLKNSQVSRLLYLADTALCLQEGQKIVEEASMKFPIQHVLCVQRIGEIKVGEIAIWTGVWSSHRPEAFEACRYVIEEIKKRLHIWKKEILNDGTCVWAYGPQSPFVNSP